MSASPKSLTPSSALEPAQPPSRIIQPPHGVVPVNLAELWKHRDLIWFLAKRDVRLRYRQTLLGAAWAGLQPAAAMVVFSLAFGRLGKMPSDGMPYALFAMCGLVPWQLFSYALLEASNSLVNNKQLLTKIYFPRLIIPLSAVLAGLVDFCVALVLLLGVMAFYRVAPGPGALLLPALVALELLTALAVSLWLAVLNVQYRDVRYTLPFLAQIWLFATPIAYPSSLVSARLRPWLGLNPMSSVVEGFRWALLGNGTPPDLRMVGVSFVLVSVMGVSGLFFFKRMERRFADVI